METEAKGKIKRIQIEAKVIRADGTEHDLGVIADSKWKFQPWKKLAAARRILELNKWRPS